MTPEFFDRNKLTLKPLQERQHDLDLTAIKDLAAGSMQSPELTEIASRIKTANSKNSSVVMMMGGHVIRSGVQRHIIDLMERGFINCVAMNGSCVIHDFEFALVGGTTESVARYIKEGQFGLWKETGGINDIVNEAYRNSDMGMAEAVGLAIVEGDFPHKDISILAACYRLGIPATVHVGIGYDIIHEHPNFSGAATGETSYRDFLRFVSVLENLNEGVIMNFGSAVMGPEVYLKALAMARNVAHTQSRKINNFTTLVCDLHNLPARFSAEPPKATKDYYFRPIKTMLVRTVADGGESFYVKGPHAQTIPTLWGALTKENK